MKKFILISMLIFLPIQVQAGFLAGNDLVKVMKEFDNAEVNSLNTNYQDATSYSAYVIGVHDTLDGLNMTCSTGSVTKRQVGAIVAKYLKSNPEKWGESAENLVFIALVNAFPCKKSVR